MILFCALVTAKRKTLLLFPLRQCHSEKNWAIRLQLHNGLIGKHV